jgi:outer membrane receptor protein involved in Fe transport
VTVPVAERTDITAGLRYTTEKRTVDGQESGIIIGNIPIGPLAAPVHDEKTFNDPTWRLAVDHHLSGDAMVYASYNRGFKSGGFNVLAFGSPAYEPEKLDAYEIGFKSEFLAHRLRANIATFYYDYQNIQVPYYTPLGEAGIKNGPKAKIYGVDGDLVAAVTEQFTLTAGFSVMHDRFQSYPNAVFNIILPTGGAIQTTGDATGNRLPFTPDWTVDVVADYTVPVSFGALSFNVTYLHSDGFFSEADNLRHQDPYDTINALVKLAGNHERWSVSLWGKNLLNEAVVTQLSGTSAGTGATYQPPRTYGITLGAKF